MEHDISLVVTERAPKFLTSLLGGLSILNVLSSKSVNPCGSSKGIQNLWKQSNCNYAEITHKLSNTITNSFNSLARQGTVVKSTISQNIRLKNINCGGNLTVKNINRQTFNIKAGQDTAVQNQVSADMQQFLSSNVDQAVKTLTETFGGVGNFPTDNNQVLRDIKTVTNNFATNIATNIISELNVINNASQDIAISDAYIGGNCDIQNISTIDILADHLMTSALEQLNTIKVVSDLNTSLKQSISTTAMGPFGIFLIILLILVLIGMAFAGFKAFGNKNKQK